MEVDAQGTLDETSVGGAQGVWTAAAEVAEGRVKGAVMIDGEAIEFDAPLTGGGAFEFPVKVSGSEGRVRGSVTGSSASGSYAFGSRQGTSSGTVTTSPAP